MSAYAAPLKSKGAARVWGRSLDLLKQAAEQEQQGETND
jgi:hypothetical protein